MTGRVKAHSDQSLTSTLVTQSLTDSRHIVTSLAQRHIPTRLFTGFTALHITARRNNTAAEAALHKMT